MSVSGLTLDAARHHLEASYGLALEGLGAEQISAAVEAAARAGGDPADPAFLARVVDCLPIDESWLFREDPLWEWLRDREGPALLATAARACRPVRVLSLGCSAGQEPYSVAILFQRMLEAVGIPASAAAGHVQVLGLDPSPARVEAARSGFVPAWSVQRCRPDWLRGCALTPDDEAQSRFLVEPSVRAMCRFEVGNAIDVAERGNAALGGFDLVLCRHVLIYFRSAEAERLAARLARGLDPGAVLALSTAEAHLLEPGGLAPLPHLAAGRAGTGPAPARPPAPARSRRRLVAHAPRCPLPRTQRRDALPVPAPLGDPVAAHVRVALEHAHAGRIQEALREARAALFHDPTHLYSRMLVGQHLIQVDSSRGREVLRALLEAAAALPADSDVPCADGLTVGQLAEAVKLLLARREAS